MIQSFKLFFGAAAACALVGVLGGVTQPVHAISVQEDVETRPNETQCPSGKLVWTRANAGHDFTVSFAMTLSGQTRQYNFASIRNLPLDQREHILQTLLLAQSLGAEVLPILKYQNTDCSATNWSWAGTQYNADLVDVVMIGNGAP
jgi:hypothetical protein